jgi:8-oxo-dGTP pyrophosphatase MutT (NUDIX family)
MESGNRQKLLDQITAYVPFNEQEERDRELILHALETEEDVFTRDNALCHMTASAWIVNADRTKALMAYHNIYDSWSWLGGHADGEEDLLSVAMKEAREEAGIRNVRPVSDEIFSLEVLTVDGHVKRDRYVSSHLHLNLTYLFEASEEQALTVKEDENSGVAWIPRKELERYVSEPWMLKWIYQKL